MKIINANTMIPFSPLTVPLTWFVSDAGKNLQPASQTPVIVRRDVNQRPPMNGQPATAGRTFAPNAEPPSRSHKNGTRPATVATDAKNEPNSGDTDNEKAIKSPIYTVYVLKHPVSADVFYVGSTKDIKKRADDYNGKGHGERISGRVIDWLSTLPAPPTLETVETCPITKIREREQFWIEHYRALGAPLLNIRDAYNLAVRVCKCVVCQSLFYTFSKAKYCSPTCKKTAKMRRRRGTPKIGTVDPLNSRGYVDPPHVGECKHCGQPLFRKSRNGRLPQYCSSGCRAAAWKQRQRETEAGGGKAQAFVFLAVIAAAVWFFWPLLSQLAAMRPTLPAAPAQVIIPAPAPANAGADPTPGITHVTGVELGASCVGCGFFPWYESPPATAVPIDAQPAGQEPAAGLLHITAAGRVYELTPAALVDCINAQNNGRRTGPICPPSAEKYAGMLGQGR